MPTEAPHPSARHNRSPIFATEQKCTEQRTRGRCSTQGTENWENLMDGNDLGRCFCCGRDRGCMFSSHPMWAEFKACDDCSTEPRCLICERRISDLGVYYSDWKSNKDRIYRWFWLGGDKGPLKLAVCARCCSTGTVESVADAQAVITEVLRFFQSHPKLSIDLTHLPGRHVEYRAQMAPLDRGAFSLASLPSKVSAVLRNLEIRSAVLPVTLSNVNDLRARTAEAGCCSSTALKSFARPDSSLVVLGRCRCRLISNTGKSSFLCSFHHRVPVPPQTTTLLPTFFCPSSEVVAGQSDVSPQPGFASARRAKGSNIYNKSPVNPLVVAGGGPSASLLNEAASGQRPAGLVGVRLLEYEKTSSHLRGGVGISPPKGGYEVSMKWKSLGGVAQPQRSSLSALGSASTSLALSSKQREDSRRQMADVEPRSQSLHPKKIIPSSQSHVHQLSTLDPIRSLRRAKSTAPLIGPPESFLTKSPLQRQERNLEDMPSFVQRSYTDNCTGSAVLSRSVSDLREAAQPIPKLSWFPQGHAWRQKVARTHWQQAAGTKSFAHSSTSSARSSKPPSRVARPCDALSDIAQRQRGRLVGQRTRSDIDAAPSHKAIPSFQEEASIPPASLLRGQQLSPKAIETVHLVGGPCHFTNGGAGDCPPVKYHGSRSGQPSRTQPLKSMDIAPHLVNWSASKGCSKDRLLDLPVVKGSATILHRGSRFRHFSVAKEPPSTPKGRAMIRCPSAQALHTDPRVLAFKSVMATRYVSCVAVCRSLPQDVFAATLAHELTHAYIFLKGIQLNRQDEEGICNAVSLLYFKYQQGRLASIDEATGAPSSPWSRTTSHRGKIERTEQYSGDSVSQELFQKMADAGAFELTQERRRWRLCRYRFGRMVRGDTGDFEAAVKAYPLLVRYGLQHMLGAYSAEFNVL